MTKKSEHFFQSGSNSLQVPYKSRIFSFLLTPAEERVLRGCFVFPKHPLSQNVIAFYIHFSVNQYT